MAALPKRKAMQRLGKDSAFEAGYKYMCDNYRKHVRGIWAIVVPEEVEEAQVLAYDMDSPATVHEFTRGIIKFCREFHLRIVYDYCQY